MKEFQISRVHGREILDSRGRPTVEAEVFLSAGAHGRAAVPSGASTGSREALELRDRDESRYCGRGVLKAVGHVNREIQNAICGRDSRDQRELDDLLNELDGSKDNSKSRLGANATLAVSLAVAHATANQNRQDLYRYVRSNLYKSLSKEKDHFLPVPMLNFINGGAHADNALDFQEFILVPHGARNFQEAMQWASEVYLCLLEGFRRGNHETGFQSYGVGDEGGFSIKTPEGMKPRDTIRFALDILMNVVKRAGHSISRDGDFAVALDPAASEFFSKGAYILGTKDGAIIEHLNSEELLGFYDELVADYPIISIEDGMAEFDERGWKIMTEHLGKKCQLVGDDLFVTNPALLTEGIRKGIGNAVLVKVNQIGTLTEALDVIKIAKENSYRTIISHRSGETEDTTISDLAVAVDAGQIKTGCLSRSDRVAKYNRLLSIAHDLGKHALFYGRAALDPTGWYKLA